MISENNTSSTDITKNGNGSLKPCVQSLNGTSCAEAGRRLGVHRAHVYRFREFGKEPKRIDLRVKMGFSETQQVDIPICRTCQKPHYKQIRCPNTKKPVKPRFLRRKPSCCGKPMEYYSGSGVFWCLVCKKDKPGKVRHIVQYKLMPRT